ncbi:MAG: hypothetical protein IPL64_04375 [Flavobacteriales bacterium]|nr:hypothetical protein [Flavobacteriales bacterium]
MVALLTLLTTTALVFAWVLWRRLAGAARGAGRAPCHAGQPTACHTGEHDADTAWCPTPPVHCVGGTCPDGVSRVRRPAQLLQRG